MYPSKQASEALGRSVIHVGGWEGGGKVWMGVCWQSLFKTEMVKYPFTLTMIIYSHPLRKLKFGLHIYPQSISDHLLHTKSILILYLHIPIPKTCPRLAFPFPIIPNVHSHLPSPFINHSHLTCLLTATQISHAYLPHLSSLENSHILSLSIYPHNQNLPTLKPAV